MLTISFTYVAQLKNIVVQESGCVQVELFGRNAYELCFVIIVLFSHVPLCVFDVLPKSSSSCQSTKPADVKLVLSKKRPPLCMTLRRAVE